MARVTAVSLRSTVREAMLSVGGRGFVRFPESGALLLSDAIRRCEGETEKKKLLAALNQAGFDCTEQNSLLMIDPSNALLAAIAYDGAFSVNWESALCGAQTVAARWLKREKRPLTHAGRQLIIDTLRLTWQDCISDGLASLRAQAAVMLRTGDSSGLYESGAVLADWCDRQEEKRHED